MQTEPLEPLYALRVAAELIPFSSVHALYVWLSRHKEEFPGRYRRVGRHEIRLITYSEIMRIRGMVVTESSRYTRRATRSSPAEAPVTFSGLFSG